jgi:hypothetical protein
MGVGHKITESRKQLSVFKDSMADARPPSLSPGGIGQRQGPS